MCALQSRFSEPRRSKRARVAKNYGLDFYAYTLEEDPTNLQKALSSLDADLWQEAINDEMDSLEPDRTWHLVNLPPGCKTIVHHGVKIALASASEEAGWLRSLPAEIPLWERPIPAVLIHCGSTEPIGKIHNRYYNGKRRQIRRKENTVREFLST
ncbi:hypothetical protein LIER_18831 [Lithospermum erythrorhizon]|uniref:Polyprotein n=1 Tax=Lithospermum erythrorhizon TaxID=34254 RepID=A0AAV3QGN1_LITER